MTSKNTENLIINFFMPLAPIRFDAFRSSVREAKRKDSDLEILYQLKNKVSLMDIVQIKERLSEIFGMKVDFLSDDVAKNKLIDFN